MLERTELARLVEREGLALRLERHAVPVGADGAVGVTVVVGGQLAELLSGCAVGLAGAVHVAVVREQ